MGSVLSNNLNSSTTDTERANRSFIYGLNLLVVPPHCDTISSSAACRGWWDLRRFWAGYEGIRVPHDAMGYCFMVCTAFLARIPSFSLWLRPVTLTYDSTIQAFLPLLMVPATSPVISGTFLLAFVVFTYLYHRPCIMWYGRRPRKTPHVLFVAPIEYSLATMDTTVRQCSP